MLFSIVIPMYNSEKYIRQCLDSLREQSFTDYEVIVVDDGSEDRSGAIADEYATRDSRIKVIHKSNGGQSTARNTGLRVAQGEYVVFLDSDDFYIPANGLAMIAEKCKNNADIIAFKYKKYFEKTNTFGECSYSYSDIDVNSGYYEKLMALIQRDAFFCSAWSKVVKKSILIDYNICFDERSRCEDMDWYYRVVSASKSIDLIDEVMIGYRQSDHSVTAVKSIKTIDQFLAFFDNWVPRIKEEKDEALKTILFNSAAKLYVNLLVSYCSLNDADKLERYKRIKEYAKLLDYHANVRVKKVWLVNRIVGLRLTLLMLEMLKKLR